MVGTVSGSGKDSKQCDISNMSLAFRVSIIGQQIFLAQIEWFYSSDDIPSMAMADDWKPYHQSVAFPPVLFLSSYHCIIPWPCSILARVGKHELIATDMVDYIDTKSLNSEACISFVLSALNSYLNPFLLSFVSFLGLSNAVFFDPIPSKHSYIHYDVPFWHWKAIHNPKIIQVHPVFIPFKWQLWLVDFQNINECCKEGCYFNGIYNPHGDPQVWCTTCEQWFHMHVARSRRTSKVRMIRRPWLSEGVASTGCFLDPINPDIKKLLESGKYSKLLCHDCGRYIWSEARLDPTLQQVTGHETKC